jgi:putative transposase
VARLPRLAIAGQPHHLIQRGTNRQLIFRDGADFARMIQLLGDHSRKSDVAIHAYVLMGNHFHLLVTPTSASGLSTLMQGVGRAYVRYFNDRYQRTGTLWEGRFKGTVINSERYLFICMAYIELNPVRAAIVATPGEYHWSSYLHNIGVRRDPLVREHSLFWALGNTPFAREAAYRQIVEAGLATNVQQEVTGATLRGWALGEVAGRLAGQAIPRRIAPLARGRPKKLSSVPI